MYTQMPSRFETAWRNCRSALLPTIHHSITQRPTAPISDVETTALATETFSARRAHQPLLICAAKLKLALSLVLGGLDLAGQMRADRSLQNC